MHGSRPLSSGYPVHAHKIGLGVSCTAPRPTGVVSGAPVALPEGVTRLPRLEGGPIEVLGVLREHLEADEVGIFVADKCAIHKDVVLFKH